MPWLAMALYNLGEAEFSRGQDQTARLHLAEAIGLSRDMGDQRRLAYALSAVARLAFAAGDEERAACFEAVASLATAAIGARARRRPSGRGVLPAHVAQRAAELQTRIAAVEAPTLEETADEALKWLACAPGVLDAKPERAPAIPESLPKALTPRERDVVGLLARGLTNRQIASTLVVTEGTAENYVQRVLGKLGFSNRTQVAAWAALRGLNQAVA